MTLLLKRVLKQFPTKIFVEMQKLDDLSEKTENV